MTHAPLEFDKASLGFGTREARFGIKPGAEHEAGLELLRYLGKGVEVCLSNDLDEGHEGYSLFQCASGAYWTKIGGHGWQGQWKPISERALLEEVVKLAPLNRGGRSSKQGSIRRIN